MYNILICDDEQDIVNALKIYLKDPNYNLLEAHNGQEALWMVQEKELHLILMDLMMPVMDGIEALSRIREISNVPVILLTAKSEDTDVILGLNLGADDYITKPFNPMVVSARVHSALRRYAQMGGAEPKTELLKIGTLELDDEAKTVTLDGEAVSVTRKEFEILRLLMKDAGKVYSPKEIYQAVWKEDPMGSENTVAVHIRHLREKIEVEPNHPKYIKVVFGHGYVIEKQ